VLAVSAPFTGAWIGGAFNDAVGEQWNRIFILNLPCLMEPLN
jgi:hypothetical protein